MVLTLLHECCAVARGGSSKYAAVTDIDGSGSFAWYAMRVVVDRSEVMDAADR